ncbi:MAG TPA: hypothetical protein PLP64_10045 [Pseudothermotoga sp.]|nr:hypothetical protein [Pseudothermotoga sp.]HOK84548.1 hypothetical protein [Pseudothermotoga sp.]HPP69445.1 hypothetical protein [Pseudothermotoga sp.]
MFLNRGYHDPSQFWDMRIIGDLSGVIEFIFKTARIVFKIDWPFDYLRDFLRQIRFVWMNDDSLIVP